MNDAELTRYYAKRSAEYERIYAKPERQDDVGKLRAMLASGFEGHDVIEIACGTGYWTECACRSARSIVATDYNEEVLERARKKDYGPCQVKFVKADAFDLSEIGGTFSAALAGFWWSHIPQDRIGGFLEGLRARLDKGATVVVFDNRYVEGSSTPISRTDERGNTYQTRRLSDGSEYEIMKNFPGEDEFRRQVDRVAANVSFTTLDYFWVARFTLRRAASSGAGPAEP